jgi:hypothetical protein
VRILGREGKRILFRTTIIKTWEVGEKQLKTTSSLRNSIYIAINLRKKVSTA